MKTTQAFWFNLNALPVLEKIRKLLPKKETLQSCKRKFCKIPELGIAYLDPMVAPPFLMP